MNVAAKTSGQPNASVPDAAGLHEVRRGEAQDARRSRPRASRRRPTTQLKTQCKQEYEALRDQVMQLLISFQWIEGEAEEQGIKVTDAEVKKSFDEQKKQSFPKDADYQKFLKDSGQTEAGHPPARQARPALEQDPRQGRQGQGQGLRRPDPGLLRQEQGALRPARAARPADRADQDARRRPTQAKAALESGAVVEGRRQEVLDRRGLQGAGRQAARRRPRARSRSRSTRPSSSAKKGKLTGPVKTQFGYYVFEVDKVTQADAAVARAGQGRRSSQTLQSQNQQKALDKFVADFQKKWKEQTECRDGYVTQECKNAPKATPTPTPRRPPAAADGDAAAVGWRPTG